MVMISKLYVYLILQLIIYIVEEKKAERFSIDTLPPPPLLQQSSSSLFAFMNPFNWEKTASNRGYSVGKQRKIPLKIEPKVFFANERTFLAWMHMSVTLASISVAIVAFAEANEWSQLYGLMLMPVAITFTVYSLWIYMKRASMIRRRDPGPYDDKKGPIALAALLAISIVVNFFVKLYHIRLSNM